MRVLLLLYLSIFGFKCFGQEDSAISETSEKKMILSGYFKDLNTVSIPSTGQNWNIDLLLHNRLNFGWQPATSIHFQLELRNRLFLGESVKNNPGFEKAIDQNLDFIQLNRFLVKGPSVLVYSVIDRCNLSFHKGKWEARVGKQRINWSQSYVWNPNDIFNAYSFFDFDYEERRGNDAFFFAYEIGALSSLQFASSIHNKWDSTIFATNYRWNKWNYDFQFLCGKYQTDLCIGTGWSGQLKSLGFSGEISCFDALTDASATTVTGTISLDYRLPSTLNFRLESIFNSLPDSFSGADFFQKPVTAKTLIANNWSAFVSIGYDITPLLKFNLNSIWNIDDDSFFLNPTITYSISPNTEFLLATQLFKGSTESLYAQMGTYVFSRLKFNF